MENNLNLEARARAERNKRLAKAKLLQKKAREQFMEKQASRNVSASGSAILQPCPDAGNHGATSNNKHPGNVDSAQHSAQTRATEPSINARQSATPTHPNQFTPQNSNGGHPPQPIPHSMQPPNARMPEVLPQNAQQNAQIRPPAIHNAVAAVHQSHPNPTVAAPTHQTAQQSHAIAMHNHQPPGLPPPMFKPIPPGVPVKVVFELVEVDRVSATLSLQNALNDVFRAVPGIAYGMGTISVRVCTCVCCALF